ncbi:hypothetical protein [Deinococcus arenae]|nr:hypothetical protein [Deinococcus arenae]
MSTIHAGWLRASLQGFTPAHPDRQPVWAAPQAVARLGQAPPG